MAASPRQAQTLTEVDDADDGPISPPVLPATPSVPSGLANDGSIGRQGGSRKPEAPEEFEVIATDDDLKPLQQPGTPLGQGQEPRPDVGQQAPAEDADQGQTPAQQKQHRTRAERRAVTREARDRTIRENQILREQVRQLSQRIDGFEPRFNEIDQGRVVAQVADLDRQIGEHTRAATEARRRMSEAMVAQDAESFASALEARDNAILRSEQLRAHKNNLDTALAQGGHVNGSQQPGGQQQQQRQIQIEQQQPQRRPLSQRARTLADEFASENDWMDSERLPDGRPRDLDTRLMLELDDSVLNDGYDPATEDYWEELRDRAARYLPHRFGAAQQPAAPAPRQQQTQQAQPAERRGPPVAGIGDRAPSNGRNQVYLSPQRKEALILAGVLNRDGVTVEDRTRLSRYLKQYQQFDRENGLVRA